MASSAAPAPASSCPASLVAGGHDYHGLELVRCNFSGLDLTGANFNGATLTGVVFIRTNLSGADFSHATLSSSQSTLFPTDFSFATLSGAKFIGTVFAGATYLTYATLNCADFSTTDISNGNAIFGDAPLVIDSAQNCRTKFQNATMNCEFVAQWNQLDLTGARIGACANELQTAAGRPGYDFSGGEYTNVVFDNLDLAASKWTGAVLEHASFQGATLDNATGLNGTSSVFSRLSGAKFNKASVQNVDLSNAQLYGAQFTNANLSNSSFAGSFLTANTAAIPPIETAAAFDGAHLKNVNLANAHLQGATFQFASFYSSFGLGAPSFPCRTSPNHCPGSSIGYTCSCATASGANLSGTNFTGAFLYGVDFSGSGTTVNGTLFSSSILIGASFDNAGFEVKGGTPPDFAKALLQGASFSSNPNLLNANLLNAFLDFGAASNPNSGNNLYLLLSADYTRFTGWPGAGKPCVLTSYNFTPAPAAVSLTCPDGSSNACGAGKPAPDPNPRWAGAIAMASNAPVAGWYQYDATYDKAPASSAAICGNNGTVDPNW